MGSLEELCKDLDKAIGDNSVAQSVTKFINTGYPPLNQAISGKYDGGLPFGRMVEVYGDSSTGKTALATKWMIEAQRMGGTAIFIDWEKSFDVDMAQEMGLNVERPYWIYKRSKTWEDGNIVASKACQAIRASKLISEDAPILVIFDSIAAALPQSTTGKEIDELTMNDTSALARVTSTTLKSQAGFAADFDATFIYLNQVREKIGVMFGDKTSTPGGKAMGFYATVRMSLTRQKMMEQRDGEKEFVGQKITINCVKSKLTAPYKKCSLDLTFDENGMARFDEEAGMIEHLKNIGAIASSGARVTWTDGKQYYVKVLAEKIRTDDAYSELVNLLP